MKCVCVSLHGKKYEKHCRILMAKARETDQTFNDYFQFPVLFRHGEIV